MLHLCWKQVVEYIEDELKLNMTSRLKGGQNASGKVTADGKKRIHESWPGAVCSKIMDHYLEILNRVSMMRCCHAVHCLTAKYCLMRCFHIIYIFY